MSGSLKLTWSDALSTGNRAIDVQHKYLVDIINELAECIEQGKAAQKVKTILNLLRHYTEWHFEREELCMERTNCPSACPNKEAHKTFIATFKAFAEEYNAGSGAEEIALRMYKTLTEWLVNHIQGIDAQLAGCSQDDVTNMKQG